VRDAHGGAGADRLVAEPSKLATAVTAALAVRAASPPHRPC
jgi:hypothetical protein